MTSLLCINSCNILAGILFLLINFPHLVNHLSLKFIKNKTSVILMFITVILYVPWCSYWNILQYQYYDKDAQGGIGFAIITMHSLPVLMMIWIAAIIINTPFNEGNKVQSTGANSTC